MKLKYLLALAALVLFGVALATTPSRSVLAQSICVPSVTNLTAGQTNVVGTLTITNDGTNLYVRYDITQPSCWTFGTLHLWAGTDFTLLPRSGGGAPIPGQFPYISGDGGLDPSTGLTSYTFTIPLADLIVDQSAVCGAQLYVVAHAEVTCEGQSETAFGGDLPGEGTNRWFFYTMYAVCCDVPEPPNLTCQTAFAKGGYVFVTDKKANPEKLPSLNLIKNRWGWAINISGDGVYHYEIWAGAGLNKTSNGKLVGMLTVTVAGGQVTVAYALNDPATMEELHIYCGDLKPQTTAPGQYGSTAYFSPHQSSYSQTFTVSDSNGDGIWIIAHAVACY